MRWPFFPFKVTILGSKKDTSFWRHPPYIAFDIVLDMCFCCFHAVLACPILKHIRLKFIRFTLDFSTTGFTLAQKNHFRSAYMKRQRHTSLTKQWRNIWKTICQKEHVIRKIPKETHMEKDCVFGLNCWKHSLVKEKQSLKQDSF